MIAEANNTDAEINSNRESYSNEGNRILQVYRYTLFLLYAKIVLPVIAGMKPKANGEQASVGDKLFFGIAFGMMSYIVMGSEIKMLKDKIQSALSRREGNNNQNPVQENVIDLERNEELANVNLERFTHLQPISETSQLLAGISRNNRVQESLSSNQNNQPRITNNFRI